MKILVIHASAGAGHTKAAEAIYFCLLETTPHQTRLVNALDYTPSRYKRIYQDGYSFVISKVPLVWGFFFGLLDFPWLQGPVRIMRRYMNGILAKRLEEFLVRERFDIIFSTHFMANEVAAYLKREKQIHAKIISVVTDFDVHRFWEVAGVDIYAVASPWTKKKLQSLGVPDEHICVTGIPTRREFREKKDTQAIRQKLHLKKDKFTVLMATGSFGLGPIEQIAMALNSLQVLIVCGRNRNLYSKLIRKREENIHPFGFVDNMDEFMAVADVMVTKPGGLSISEALVSQLPLLFFSAIPGQETNNIKVLKSFGIGLGDGTVDGIVREIKALSQSPDYFRQARESVKALSCPRAVDDIVKLIS